MSKSVNITYEKFVNGRPIVVTEPVLFSKKTTEYVESLSYLENMEAMIFDIFENGFIFIDDKTVITVFCIKSFAANDILVPEANEANGDKRDVQEKPQQNSNNSNKQSQLNKKWKHIKHKRMNPVPQHIIEKKTDIPIMPIKPEEVINKIEESPGISIVELG